jgi:hypothetical protein
MKKYFSGPLAELSQFVGGLFLMAALIFALFVLPVWLVGKFL